MQCIYILQICYLIEIKLGILNSSLIYKLATPVYIAILNICFVFFVSASCITLYSRMSIQNLNTFDPFADAARGSEDGVQDGLVHIRFFNFKAISEKIYVSFLPKLDW
ncbi:Protein translation factor SUI1-like protein [Armadillidium nasatum]|uniref:Protein translation factor SUI1-like protein n=1 Tax=Armadillidium nasatum TaxID=96803 RepID=A0A5N5SSK8_9CRUS|nr:Protein translation factor SUI1-like protein [Armadillidium nasatum]